MNNAAYLQVTEKLFNFSLCPVSQGGLVDGLFGRLGNCDHGGGFFTLRLLRLLLLAADWTHVGTRMGRRYLRGQTHALGVVPLVTTVTGDVDPG